MPLTLKTSEETLVDILLVVSTVSRLVMSFLQVILTGDLTGSFGFRIFLSTDSGKSFIHSDLLFSPRMQIMYNPQNATVLAAISNKVRRRVMQYFTACIFKCNTVIRILRGALSWTTQALSYV